MNIGGLQIGYGIEVPDKITLNIYVSGCKNNKRCRMGDCHNPNLRIFDFGTPYKEWYKKIDEILEAGLVEAVCILGGEPFDQDSNELSDLINYFNIPVFIYTGYDEAPKVSGVAGIFYGHYNINQIKGFSSC